MTTHYDILDVAPSAKQEEIRKAYRRLSKRFHPDLNKGAGWAEERFKRINEAYAILSDPLLRRQYDTSLDLFRATFSTNGKRSTAPEKETFSAKNATPGAQRRPFRTLFAVGTDDLLRFSRLILFFLFAGGIILLGFSSAGNSFSPFKEATENTSDDRSERALFLELYSFYPNLISVEDARRILEAKIEPGYTEQLWYFLKAGEMDQFEKMIADPYYFPYLKNRLLEYEEDQRRPPADPAQD